MTMEEIKKSDKDFLVPTDIAPVLKCSAYAISLQARDDASALGFPVIRLGRNTKIPRKPFVKFMEDGVYDMDKILLSRLEELIERYEKGSQHDTV